MVALINFQEETKMSISPTILSEPNLQQDFGGSDRQKYFIEGRELRS